MNVIPQYSITFDHPKKACVSFSGSWTLDHTFPDDTKLINILHPGVDEVCFNCYDLLEWDSLFPVFLRTLQSFCRQYNIRFVDTDLPDGVKT